MPYVTKHRTERYRRILSFPLQSDAYLRGNWVRVPPPGVLIHWAWLGVGAQAKQTSPRDSDPYQGVKTTGLGDPFFFPLHQERGKEFSLEESGQLDYFSHFSKVTKISPNLLSLFSLKAVAQGTLPILICLFFPLSFHYSYFLY